MRRGPWRKWEGGEQSKMDAKGAVKDEVTMPAQDSEAVS
jgi:hypothetical protein